MNNSVFGKTQENLRKRVNVEIITYANILRKRAAKPIVSTILSIVLLIVKNLVFWKMNWIQYRWKNL